MDSERKGSIVRARKLRNPFVGVTGKRDTDGPSSSGDDTAQHRKHLAQLEAHRRRAIKNWLRRRRRRRRRVQRTMDEWKTQLNDSLRANLAQTQGDRRARRAAVVRAVAVHVWLFMRGPAVAATTLVDAGSDTGEDDDDDDDEDADAASGGEDRDMDDNQVVSEETPGVPECK
ncbi:hypothetical protein DL770_010994 [Monosporascus sp. CRB-9-2]|nr:hypothetical protein DL770_010994 [Monosporascus sp. CRB-9-2]